jgi:hypothetical protein
MRNNQELKSHKDKNQITTKNDDAKDANVWSLSEWYGQVTHLRAPLYSMTIDPKTRSPELTPWDR